MYSTTFSPCFWTNHNFTQGLKSSNQDDQTLPRADPVSLTVLIRLDFAAQRWQNSEHTPRILGSSVHCDPSCEYNYRTVIMDAFCATWKLIDSQNFDEYMKALGKST